MVGARLLARVINNSITHRSYSSKKTGSLAAIGLNVHSKEVRNAQFAKYEISPKEIYPRFEIGLNNNLTTIKQLNILYHENLTNGEKNIERIYKICGRVISKRASSSKLFFLDIQQDHQMIQVVISQNSIIENGNLSIDEFKRIMKIIHRGDICSFIGYIGRTNSGELSIFATKEIKLLSPCLHELPAWNGLRDPEKRFRNRHVDLIVNEKPIEILKTRSKIIKFIRRFFEDKGFIEVETPLLSSGSGGANARPFITHHNALNMSLNLRVAPELFLKQLIVGGFEKIFEIGKNFRNEGIDTIHNPEFTSCEFYQTYANLDTLKEITEDLLMKMIKEIKGSDEISISIKPRVYVDDMELDSPKRIISFKKPFKEIHLIDELEKQLDMDIPLDTDENAIEMLKDICRNHNIVSPSIPTWANLIDKLVSHLIEPTLIQPTFIIGHPLALSPLSKSYVSRTARSDREIELAARCELFINGREIVNAYEELNDPEEQRARFHQQEQDRNLGDLESHPVDEGYCQVLEYGLPPTGGWGMGLDRLCMLFTDSYHIREVLAFPAMKPRYQNDENL